MYASFYGKTDTVSKLIESGANVNEKDNDGWTALTHVSLNGKTDTVTELKELVAK